MAQGDTLSASHCCCKYISTSDFLAKGTLYMHLAAIDISSLKTAQSVLAAGGDGNPARLILQPNHAGNVHEELKFLFTARGVRGTSRTTMQTLLCLQREA